MKNLRPIGIPHSILFENLFAKTYDLAKLEEDKARIQDFYQTHGYFAARVLDQKVNLRNTAAGRFRIPFLYKPKPGIDADIMLPMEEGRLYHLRNVNYVGVKLFRVPESLTGPMFRMKQGDVFSTEKLRKGMESTARSVWQLRLHRLRARTASGDRCRGTDQIDLTIKADEGKQFYVRRIDFQGNTTTRDKVIRRELLIDEGDLFNAKMWEIEHSAPEPAGLFRGAQERGGGADHAQPAVEHGGYHAQGEGARQEHHRADGRRVGHRGQLHRGSITRPITSWAWARRFPSSRSWERASGT